MQGIEFEKETFDPIGRPRALAPKQSFLVRLVFKLSDGKIKDEAQAYFVLLIIAVILLLLSIYNFIAHIHKPTTPAPTTPAEIQQMQKIQQLIKTSR